jgi:hypothetical protein
MRIAVRAAFGVAVALFATAVLAVTSIVSVTAWAATTALIMGGTGDPLVGPRDTNEFVEQYLGMAENNYISPSSALPTGVPQGPYNPVAVYTPAEFKTDPNASGLTYDQSVALGLVNLHNCITASGCVYNTEVGSVAPAPGDKFVVFGYSQSATIATLEKQRLAAEFANGQGPDVSFVLIGNGNRPNGGFLARGPRGYTIPFPLIFGGATFSGPTPTNTQYDTVDIVNQYDNWADFPLNPFNPFAMLNWYSSSTHYNYPGQSLDGTPVVDQGQYGDTHYYMYPSRILPLLQPLTGIPVVGFALADALDAPFRVLVEAGYDRSASPGQPMPWNPLYVGDPVKLVINLAVSIPTGIDNGVEVLTGIRPLGTKRPGPYGVGGPPVTYVDPPATADEPDDAALMTATEEVSGSPDPNGPSTIKTAADLRVAMQSRLGNKNGKKSPETLGDELPDGSLDGDELPDASLDDDPAIEDSKPRTGVFTGKVLTPERQRRRESFNDTADHLRKLVTAGTRTRANGASPGGKHASSNTGNDNRSQGSEKDSAA